ncbi:MAG: hypothetical protein NT141_00285 [candidate division WWE3 bacterium]|nr:hypothetical protein [candidate division WWE3 bacterium]
MNTLVSSIYPIERELENLKNFTVVLQKIKGTISYTDFLMYCCLYKFPKAYLLTENHKDFTTEILERRYIVTIDTDKEIRHQAFYQISLDKFKKAEAAFAKSSLSRKQKKPGEVF